MHLKSSETILLALFLCASWSLLRFNLTVISLFH